MERNRKSIELENGCVLWETKIEGETKEILKNHCREYGRELPDTDTCWSVFDFNGVFEGQILLDDCGELLAWDNHDFFSIIHNYEEVKEKIEKATEEINK